MIPFLQVVGNVRIFRMMPSVHRHVVYFAQFSNSTDVIMVAMGAQDGLELQFMFAEESQHRCCFAGINYGGLDAIMDGPDVVVIQGRDGCDFNIRV